MKGASSPFLFLKLNHQSFDIYFLVSLIISLLPSTSVFLFPAIKFTSVHNLSFRSTKSSMLMAFEISPDAICSGIEAASI